MKVFQKGFNYSQDGRGNRLVFHLQGCNMKCPWCSNPEGMPIKGVLVEEQQWLLESICPKGAIFEEKIHREYCEECIKKECVTKAKTKGVRLSYEEYAIEEIVELAKDNRMMYYDGGGVTFTGGEATLQFEELKIILEKLKQENIHTAIETNGSHKRLLELLPYIDQLIMDCKLVDGKKHLKITGIENKQILSNIRSLAKQHKNLHIRFPIIGGVNDDEKSITDFLRFIDEVKGESVTFEVLSYHEYGKKKWEQCGWNYQMDDRAYVEEIIVKDFKNKIIEKAASYLRT